MQPFVTEASCLKCHGKQGYKVGDVRGGLSVSVPLAPFYRESENSLLINTALFLAVWGAVVLLSIPISRKLYGLYLAHIEAAKLLRTTHQQLALDMHQQMSTSASLVREGKRAGADTQDLIRELGETQQLLVDKEKSMAFNLLVEGISHELNTPLGAIVSANGSLRFLLTDMADKNELLNRLVPRESVPLLQAFFAEYVAAFRPEAPVAKETVTAAKLQALCAASGVSLSGDRIDAIADLLIPFEAEPYLSLFVQDEAFVLLRNFAAMHQCISLVENAAEKAALEIERLRMYTLDQAPEPFKPIRVSVLVRSALDRFSNHFDRVALSVDLDEQLILLCQPAILEKAIFNIIENSFQAVNYSGAIAIEARRDGDSARIAVADNGPQIPEEIRSRLFRPFVTDKKSTMGVGLGLFIAKKIIAKHDGTIQFSSAPGRTEFTIVIPVKGA